MMTDRSHVPGIGRKCTVMRNCFAWMGIGCLCFGLGGCGDQATDGTSDSGEVPQAGPAAIEQDIGPAPEGQTEPPIAEPPPVPEPDTTDATPPEAALPKDADAIAADPETSDTPETNGAEDVTLSLVTWDEGQQLVASKAGRVVVLDLWSTTCVPCRKEFPHFVQLHRDRGDAVACIAYSLDYSGRASRPPESYRDKVLAFLKQQDATFDNLLGTDDPDALHLRLDLAAIPAVYVYDKTGKLRKRFDNEDPDREEFTYEKDVIPLVEELLAEE